ncbi:phosphate/phosphite/phosphonate ABC transporter substrate-binding protein [Propionispira arboris]
MKGIFKNMIYRQFPLLLISFLCLFSLSGCNRTQSEDYIDFNKSQPMVQDDITVKNEQRPLVIALAAVISPQETIDCYRILAQRISTVTGHPTVLIQRKTYMEVNKLLSNGEADMAFLSTGSYVSYHGFYDIDILAMAALDDEIVYRPYIIVNKDSNIYSVEDLAGRTFAFTDPLSFSGHLIIEDMLHSQGTNPERYFKRYFYTYNHDKSIWAVAHHVADAASIDSQIYDYAKIKHPEITNNIRIISVLDAAPTGPVVVRKDLPQEQIEQLRQIFLEMNQDPDTAQAMKKLMIDRFISPQPERYIPLKKIYDRTTI